MRAVWDCQEMIFIILRRKPVVGDSFGEGRGIGGRSFEKSAPLLVKSPAKMLFLSAIQTNLQGTSFLMRRYVMREYRHPKSIRGRHGSYQRVFEAEDRGRPILGDTVRQAHGRHHLPKECEFLAAVLPLSAIAPDV